MPVVAIAGAAIAADAVATATVFSAVTAMEAVAAVGGVLSAVGQITGNKGLAMAGTVLGVVGGIGSLAGSAGLLGDSATTSLFGSSDAASSAADTSATAASDTSAFGGTGAAAGTGGDIPAISADPLSAVGVSDTGQVTIGEGTSALEAANPTDPSIEGETAGEAVNGEGATPPTAAPAPEAAATTAATNQAAPTSLINGAPNAPASPGLMQGSENSVAGGEAMSPENANNVAEITGSPSSSQGIFGKLFDFAHNNQTLTMGVLQAGGNFLSGLTNPATPAQIAALNAQAAANNAAAGLTAMQRQNEMQPKAVATNVTGNNTPPPVSPGLINSTPVTGSPSGIPVASTPNSQKVSGVAA